jgi:hypothetical protein
MMDNTALNHWLDKATRCLARESAAQVRREIEEHYDAALETAVKSGMPLPEAEKTAIQSLGNPKVANRQYRRVLLTSSEARMLRIAQREASAVCSRGWLVWLLRAITIVGLLGSGVAALYEQDQLARLLFVVGIGNGVFTASTFLRIRTPKGARVFRSMKWSVVLLVTRIMFGPDPSKWLSGAIVCFGALAWTEWTYFSIRRKLPVAQWPRALFF